MTEQDLKYQDLKRRYEAMKKENERLRFSNSLLEKELQQYREAEEQIVSGLEKEMEEANRCCGMYFEQGDYGNQMLQAGRTGAFATARRIVKEVGGMND